MRFSLKQLLIAVTLGSVLLGIGLLIRDRVYTRNKNAQLYFENLGARVVIGDPCPPSFVYRFDGNDRQWGLPDTAKSPNSLERAIGFRFTWKPVRELKFHMPHAHPPYFDGRVNIDSEIFANIAELAPEVEVLHTPFPVKAGKRISQSNTPQLFEAIAELEQLRELSIYGWAVSDEDIKALRKLSRLQVLFLHEPKISDAGLESLREFPSLRYFDLFGMTVSPEAIKKLKMARPELLIVFNGRL